MKARNYRKSSTTCLKTSSRGDQSDQGLTLKSSSSASRFFDKLRYKVFGRPLSITLEGDTPSTVSLQELPTKESQGVKELTSVQNGIQDGVSSYLCHLCKFSTDRITLLDRHLLEDHKIGLDNLLKLLIAKASQKTRTEGTGSTVNRSVSENQHGGRTSYYQLSNLDECDATTVFDKIRNLSRYECKTVATNTENAEMSLIDSCNEVNRQLEHLLSAPLDKYDQKSLLSKMASLNDVMRKIIDSSNAGKHLESKPSKQKCGEPRDIIY